MGDINNHQVVNASDSAQVNIGVVQRTQGSSEETPAALVMPGVGLLFVAANPGDSARLGLDQEIRRIEGALRSASGPESFKVAQAWAADEEDLQEALLRYQPEIVHLSGHGLRSGEFLFAPSRNGQSPAATKPDSSSTLEALTRLFSAAKGRTRCVVINACHSARLAEMLSAHVDVTLGMAGSIDDEAATSFARAFYSSIAYGVDAERAFRIACAQMMVQGGDRKIPRLFASRINPSQLVFGAER